MSAPQVYRYIFDFLESQPSDEQIAAFHPTQEMVERLRTLLDREKKGEITEAEKDELDEYEQIEHMVIMIKTSSLKSSRS